MNDRIGAAAESHIDSDGVIKGGFGSAVLEFSAQNNYTRIVKTLGIPDEFIEHGTVEELQRYCKIDIESLVTIFSSC